MPSSQLFNFQSLTWDDVQKFQLKFSLPDSFMIDLEEGDIPLTLIEKDSKNNLIGQLTNEDESVIIRFPIIYLRSFILDYIEYKQHYSPESLNIIMAAIQHSLLGEIHWELFSNLTQENQENLIISWGEVSLTFHSWGSDKDETYDTSICFDDNFIILEDLEFDRISQISSITYYRFKNDPFTIDIKTEVIDNYLSTHDKNLSNIMWIHKVELSFPYFHYNVKTGCFEIKPEDLKKLTINRK